MLANSSWDSRPHGSGTPPVVSFSAVSSATALALGAAALGASAASPAATLAAALTTGVASPD
jgi:hypothetical protein